jgi:predicted glycogen debranching enzyme
MAMAAQDLSALGFDTLLDREWLVTNGVGGYASSTLVGLNTRKYHGLLVAAMTPPVQRMVLLSRVEETVHLDGWPRALDCNEYPGTIFPEGWRSLRAFAHVPFPRWAYQADDFTIEKSLQLLRGENTVVITYTLLGGEKPVELAIRPLLALRPIHELTYQWNGRLEAENKSPKKSAHQHHRIPPTSRTPEVFFAHDGAFEAAGTWYLNQIYRREQSRGYAGLEDLWSPGILRWKLSPGQSVNFVCSTDPIDLAKKLSAAEAERMLLQPPIVVEPAADMTQDLLVRAASEFVIDSPASSPVEPAGKSLNLISQYPWSPPSGRDALIGFTGLLLCTEKIAEAGALLQSMAERIKNGLVPTEFPEDGSEPLYNGADTSLWFVDAIYHFLRYGGDEAVARKLLDVVLEIISKYQHGTDLGLVADADGLLCMHAPGIGATWMNAKVGDWVITPRSGRPVEVNALWYNAICVAAQLCERFGRPSVAEKLQAFSTLVQGSFNKRFWNADASCCYDVVSDHGQDPSIRPNQLLAISLPFAVLSLDRHEAVLKKLAAELLTPMGLRTLSPRDPAYQGRYGGNVVSRDRAYHNGSVFPWLLGPWVTSYLKVHGRGEKSRVAAMAYIEGCITHMRGVGLGHLRELFDGDAPHHPKGGIASAINVGEVLRAYVEDILDLGPKQAAPAMPAVQVEVSPAAKLAKR